MVIEYAYLNTPIKFLALFVRAYVIIYKNISGGVSVTKQEASDIFDSKEDVLDKLLDYILIEKNYDRATKFIMGVVGCEESVARQLVLETIPKETDNIPIKNTPIIECPYCHSINTTKITAAAKAVNIALFGLHGNKRKYQWYCNDCKSDF